MGRLEKLIGKTFKPWKMFYLQLAADVTGEVYSDRDLNGVLFSPKGMMRCGLELNLNEKWKDQQLLPHLQVIPDNYIKTFDGKIVVDRMELYGAETKRNREDDGEDIIDETM